MIRGGAHVGYKTKVPNDFGSMWIAYQRCIDPSRVYLIMFIYACHLSDLFPRSRIKFESLLTSFQGNVLQHWIRSISRRIPLLTILSPAFRCFIYRTERRVKL